MNRAAGLVNPTDKRQSNGLEELHVSDRNGHFDNGHRLAGVPTDGTVIVMIRLLPPRRRLPPF